MNPNIPAIMDASSTPVLTINRYSGCSAKASSATKMDMVKPMPPSTETAATWLKLDASVEQSENRNYQIAP